jgi:ABC-type dipeptide/oligopeptide/nickel transport system ATPase subunit
MHGNTVAAPPLLDVQDLSVRFVSREATVTAVNGATFSLREGEVLCLLGESGSGKSVTLRALMRLLPAQAEVAGRVELGGQDVLALEGKALRAFRGGVVSMVFQEPMTALDPVYTIGQHLVEMIRQHRGGTRAEARTRAIELLDLVKIPSATHRLDAYPHELSGGLRQRAMIAIALCCGPRLLLADEPTTALDATVQIQVLILLRRLQRELGNGHHLRRPRFGCGGGDRGSCGGDVCRAGDRGGAGRGRAARACAPLHCRPARFDRARPGAGPGYRCDPGEPARSPPAAARLQLRSAMQPGHGGMSPGLPRPGLSGAGPDGSLPACRGCMTGLIGARACGAPG